MPSAAVYARVSTGEQSVALQVESLCRHAEHLGFSVPPGQSYSDAGVSGRAGSRPEFDRLRQSIQARAIDAVFVTKLDRIARSVPTALQFFEDAEAVGVRIIVTDQAIDTGTPAGRLTRTILAAVAEFEGDLIRERTQVAMDAIRSGVRETRSGRPVGRPPRVTAALAAKIGHLRSSGLAWKAVAQRVGLPAETCRHAEQLLARRVRGGNNPAPSENPAPPGKGA